MGIVLLLVGVLAPLIPAASAAAQANPPATGTLRIWVHGTDGIALSGATFTVTDATGASHNATSSDGVATLGGLAAGPATVTQTGTAPGYTVQEASQRVTIVADTTTEAHFTNTALPPDADSDGVPDDQDPTPNGETDTDDIPDELDNCRTVDNPDQRDSDGDGAGDACDDTPLPVVDSDDDGTPDDQDPTPNGEADTDDVPDDVDNCREVDNPDQADADGDGIGDACDETPEGDSLGIGIMQVGEVSPELPDYADGSCVDGAYTEPMFEPATTEGIAYSYDRELDEFLRNGGNLKITAQLTGDSSWGAVDSTVWDVDGDSATTTITIKAPPCITLTMYAETESGPQTGNVTVAWGDTFGWGIGVTNSGGPAGNMQLRNRFPSAFVEQSMGRDFGSSGDGGCSELDGSEIECAIFRLGAGESAYVYVSSIATSENLLDTRCGEPYSNSTFINSVGGVSQRINSNTVTLTIQCATAVPELPDYADGSCVDGAYTAPTFEPATTEGITYSYDRQIDELLESGGDLEITATRSPDYPWGNTDGWTVNGNIATAIVSLVNPPCLTITKYAATITGLQTGDASVAWGDRFGWHIVVTNTGATATDVQISDTFPATFVDRGTGITFPSGGICPKLDGGGIECSTATLNQGSAVTISVATIAASDTLGDMRCGTPYANSASVTSAASGSIESNTVTITIECPTTAVPELPTYEDGSCDSGAFSRATFTPADTEGITYSYDPAFEEVVAKGGDLKITATLDSDATWGDVDETDWDVGDITATTTITINVPPCFTFVKSIDLRNGNEVSSLTVTPGQAFSWLLTVVNTGTAPITQIRITDEYPMALRVSAVFLKGVDRVCDQLDADGLNCSTEQPLASGESMSIRVDVRMDATPAVAQCAEGVDNTAYLVEINGQTANVASNTVHLDFDCASPVAPVATDGTCVDGAYTGPAFEPATTEGIIYSYDRELDEFLANGGDLEITATLADTHFWGAIDDAVWDVDGRFATTSVTVDNPPCAAIGKSGPASVVAPGSLDYAITVTAISTGGSDSVSIAVDDPLPDTGASWSTADPACAITGDTGTQVLTCTLEVSAADIGKARSITVSSAVSQEAGVCGQTFTNRATITALNDSPVEIASNDVHTTIECPVDPDLPDVVNGVCADGVFTEPKVTPPTTAGIEYSLGDIPLNGNLTITASLMPGFSWGNTDGWTIDGDSATRTVPVASALCANAELAPPDIGQASCVDGQPDVPTIALPASGDGITYAVDADGPYVPGQVVTVSATLDPVGYAWPDSLPGDWQRVDAVTATWTVELLTPDCPHLSVTKTVTSESTDLDLGDVVTYEIVVTNSGNTPLGEIAVTDDLVIDLDCAEAEGGVLEPQAELACTASHTITEADILAGSFTNIVAVEGVAVPDDDIQALRQADREVVRAEASASVTTVAPRPLLELVKTVDPTGPVRAGDTLTYTFEVSNGGNVTVDGGVVTDLLPGLVWDASGGVIGTLAPGEVRTVEATYVVTKADAVAGAVTNEATATGTWACAEPDPDAEEGQTVQAADGCPVTSAPGSVTVKVTAPPAEAPAAGTPAPTSPQAGSGMATETLVTTLPSTGHHPATGDTGPAALLLALMALAAALAGVMLRADRRRYL